LLVMLIPAANKTLIRGFTLVFSLLGLAVSAVVWVNFDGSTSGLQMVEKGEWIPSLGVSYYLAIDGISLLLVVLTAFLLPIVVLSTYKAVEDGVKGFMFSLLLLQVGMLGAFLAQDVFLFYSLLMLVAVLYVYFTYSSQAGAPTTELALLYNTKLSVEEQVLLFAAFALAFAIKVPMFPFHTWLPDAHVEAPTAGSVILAAVLLKMGTYGFVRFAFPLFPTAAIYAVPIIAVLAVIGIIYGALVAMVQPDMKKLIAYSSVSHLGFVMLGIAALTPMGVAGGLLQMVNHGISTGMLFLLVGVVYERRHTRLISEYGGLAKQMPWYAVTFLVATLASIGLPGTNGFVGEFLIMIGTFNSDALPVIFGSDIAGKVLAAIAGLGVILGAVYMLWLVQRVFFGPLSNEKNKKLKDLSLREGVVMLPLIVIIFVIGLFPNLFLSKVEPSIDAFVEDVRNRAEMAELAIDQPETPATEKTNREKEVQDATAD
jgi:NADH-quinone oxidoreductase subunit M